MRGTTTPTESTNRPARRRILSTLLSRQQRSRSTPDSGRRGSLSFGGKRNLTPNSTHTEGSPSPLLATPVSGTGSGSIWSLRSPLSRLQGTLLGGPGQIRLARRLHGALSSTAAANGNSNTNGKYYTRYVARSTPHPIEILILVFCPFSLSYFLSVLMQIRPLLVEQSRWAAAAPRHRQKRMVAVSRGEI